jgi:hypothetical protein
VQIVLDDVKHDFELAEEQDTMTIRFQARQEFVKEDEFAR